MARSIGLGRWLLMVAAGCILTVVGGTGCQSFEGTQFAELFTTVPERPLADVPVPDGFRYKERGSYIFSSNYRVARLKYSGTPNLETTVAFFREHMPMSHWRVTDEQADGRASTLVFSNKEEACTVSFTRRSGLTYINIDITPRAS